MRYVVANLICLGLLLAGAVAGTLALGGSVWLAVAVGCVGFFVFGWLVERLAPGTRLLHLLGLQDPRW